MINQLTRLSKMVFSNIFKLSVLILVLLTVESNITSSAQSDNKQLISKHFKWDESQPNDSNLIESYQISFSGATNRDNNNLPVYKKNIQLNSWNESTNSIEISIKNIEYIYCNPFENNLLKTLQLTDTILDHYITYSDGIPSLNIVITPFKKDNIKKFYQKIQNISFELTINQHSGKTLKNSKVTTYPSSSLLANGKWVKVKVTQSGIHKIPYSTLSSWGFSNPSNVKIYGTGGKMLPKLNSVYRKNDMVENATYHTNNNIYFYAQGIVNWQYNSANKMFMHELHDYTNDAYYFLSEEGPDYSIEEANYNSETANITSNTYNLLQYHEKNTHNFIKSGRAWYGEEFNKDILNERAFEFNIPDIDLESNAKIQVTAISRSNYDSRMTVYADNTVTAVGNMSYGRIINLDNNDGNYAYSKTSINSFSPNSEKITIYLKYSASTDVSKAYLDKIDLNTRRKLSYSGSQFSFRDINTVGTGNTTQFLVETITDSNVMIWDITDNTQPIMIEFENSGNSISFNYPTSELKEFVIFSTSESIPTPEFAENINNQNLHAIPQVDYLIIAADVEGFYDEANRLAKLHQDYNNLTTAVVTQNQIFNEFSSGQPDVTAIRSFVKMFYDRAGNNKSKRPKYLLLFGDGSYDNKSTKKDNTNLILTYQSEDGINYTNSYTTDDFFGLLDDNEGSRVTGESIDIGIGRFPIHDINEAEIAVNKVETYLTNQDQSRWKTKVTFVADDQDENQLVHMSSADEAADILTNNNPEFDISKIYLDAYQEVTSTNGSRYPGVEEAIDNTLENGTMVFNYTGHGGEHGLAHERIITIEKIRSWTNLNRLSLFVTATCEFSRYDDYEFTSAGEEIFLNPQGGGIALLTTTRIVYTGGNKYLNNRFYDYAFARDSAGNKPRLGDIIKNTKRRIGLSVNSIKFTLLGDPAIQLCYPKEFIKPIIINNDSISANQDTIKALSLTSINSKIVPFTTKQESFNDSQTMTDFNGSASTLFYDKPITITTLGNNGNTPYEFETYENILYKGSSSAAEGSFNNTFMVPKDIKYNYGKGRLTFYAIADDGTEAMGAYTNIIVGGSVTGTNDTKGPEIEMCLNNESFVNGGTVNSTPLLMADMHDDNGINTSGNSIGHNITLTIDNGDEKYNLNSYFEGELNNYQKGSIIFQIPELSVGEHTLTLKAWDTYNNSSEATLRCKVKNSGDLNIEQINSYPNPINNGNSYTMTFFHDAPNAFLSTSISIYSLNGLLIDSEEQQIIASGSSAYIETDITSNLSPGIYMIQLEFESSTGKSGTINKKIVAIK